MIRQNDCRDRSELTWSETNRHRAVYTHSLRPKQNTKNNSFIVLNQ